MKAFRILMVNLGLPPESRGGTEYYTQNLSRSLSDKGHKLGIFCALGDLAHKNYSVRKTSQNDISVYRISTSHLFAKKFADFFIDHRVNQEFSKVIRDFKPDVIHFHHLAYLSANLPEIAHKLGIPSIMTLHDYWYICYRSRLLRPNNQICPGPDKGKHCANCDDGVAPNPTKIAKHPNLLRLLHSPSIKKLVDQSLQIIPHDQISQVKGFITGSGSSKAANFIEPDQETIQNHKFRFDTFAKQLVFPRLLLSPSVHLKKRYEKAGIENIKLLPLGFEKYASIPPIAFNGTLKLTFLGSLEMHKGVRELIAELYLLKNTNVKVTLNVYGHPKDPIYAALLKKSVEESDTIKIIFHGSYESDKDLSQVLKDCHFVVFPSIWEENYPLVIREALLHGRPVIASNLGGASECIRHYENGFLYNPLVAGELKELLLSLNHSKVIEKLQRGACNSIIEPMTDHVNKVLRLYQDVVKKEIYPILQDITPQKTVSIKI